MKKIIITSTFCIINISLSIFLSSSTYAQQPKAIVYGSDSIMVSGVDNGNVTWGGYGILTNAISSIDGSINTTKITSTLGINGGINYAAYICDTLTMAGYSNWYLPSKYELNAIYLNKTFLGISSIFSYWSSTESGINNAWIHDFLTGNADDYSNKLQVSKIRCIRKIVSNQTITDIDSNTYNTVKIGNQTWMKGNLKTTKFNDGTAIPNITDDLTWGTTKLAALSYYNKDSIYNKEPLYNWHVVNNSKNVCPANWHVPTATDWETMINYLGGGGAAQTKVFSGGTNSSGLTMTYNGCRVNHGYSFCTLDAAYFWTSSILNSASAYNVRLKFDSIAVGSDKYTSGFNIRCLKDNASTDFTYYIDSITKTVTLYENYNATSKCLWQLGNATISTEEYPIIIYAKGGFYRVSQSIVDTTSNQILQTEKIININDGTSDCEAEFNYTINTTNQSAQFNNASLGKNLSSYIWDFGDKQTATTVSPAHTFASDNYFNVCLTVMGNTCKNITCKSIKTGTDYTKENASFIYVSDKQTNKVYFNDYSSGAKKWNWSFGDGTTSALQHPQHVYTDTGLYHVTLEINSATDASQIYSALVNVHSNINSLRASFISKEKTTPTKGVLPIEFKGVGYGDASEVEWNFGDGTKSSTSMSPIHEYAQSGKYNVCMTVYDSLAYQTFTYCDTIEIGLVGINHSSLLINNSEFEMYPNPAKQSLVISIKSLVNTNTEERICITNAIGQTVFTNYYRLATNYSIDLTQFESGVYFVKVGNTVKKLIVNN